MKRLKNSSVVFCILQAICLFACGEGQTIQANDTCEPECLEGYTCSYGTCISTEEEPDALECSPECQPHQTCENGVCIDIEQPPVEPLEAAVLVTPLEGLGTVQGIVNAHFSVSLASKPKKNVDIPITSTRTDAGTLSTNKLVFTAENWNMPQTVEIQAADQKLDDAPIQYIISVGPSQSDDPNYHNLEALSVKVTHHNQAEDTNGIKPQSLTLDKTEANLFLRQVKPKNPSAATENAVTITATLDSEATDQNVYWEVKNITDDVDYTQLVSLSYEDIHEAVGTAKKLKLTRLEYDLNDTSSRDKKLDKARTLQVTAFHNSGIKATATVELKPYLSPGFSITYLKNNIRDFKLVKPIAQGNFGDMACRHYDEETTRVFNQDMMRDYVEPMMYKHTDGKLYPSRASVLAAARFLVTQFPWDISYAGQNDFRETKPEGTTVPYTHSSYIWAKTYNSKQPEAENYTLYGLNLTDTGYNHPAFTEADIIEKDGIPWNCSYRELFGQDLVDDEGKEPYNGLRCTGFVTWAMRNGQFGLADVYADTFGQIFKKDSAGIVTSTRAYMNPDTYAHFKGGKSYGLIYAGFDEAYEKLNKLTESDFVYLTDLDAKNSKKIKAGDVLWYLGYTCEEGKQCPQECKKGGGHFALVLGISYEKENIKYFYVAEAASVGNKLSAVTLDGMKNWNKPKKDAWGKIFQSGDTCRERRVIKFDNVYNYYSDQLNVPEYEGNTYQFTDMWW